MSLHDQPKEYSPEVISAFEAAYNDIWNRLYARVSRNEEATKELEIALSQTLAALVTNGVTDSKELRQRAFEAMALSVQ